MNSTKMIGRRSAYNLNPISRLTESSLDGMARRKALMGYLFVLPTLLGILIFVAGPIVVSMGLSLYKWNVFQPAEFVGFDNYWRFYNDTQALASFFNTIKFVVFAVILQISLGLLLALMVEKVIEKGLRYFFRSAFFLPLLTSAASISIVLSYMFNKEFGAVNYYLGLLGIPLIPWLTSSDWAMVTIVLAYSWQTIGFTFILFVGGLGNIPREILEAADIDGAQGWHRLWRITLPLLSPTVMFAAVIGVINALQVFEHPFVLTRGGPGDASRTAVMIIYQSAFKNFEIGYGSTAAVVLFLMILAATYFQFELSKRWVFYQ